MVGEQEEDKSEVGSERSSETGVVDGVDQEQETDDGRIRRSKDGNWLQDGPAIRGDGWEEWRMEG